MKQTGRDRPTMFSTSESLLTTYLFVSSPPLATIAPTGPGHRVYMYSETKQKINENVVRSTMHNHLGYQVDHAALQLGYLSQPSGLSSLNSTGSPRLKQNKKRDAVNHNHLDYQVDLAALQLGYLSQPSGLCV
jgi:hypothetical protein